MSRIAGILSDIPSHQKEHLLARMLCSLQSVGSWQSWMQTRLRATFGFCGQEARALVTSPAVMVVMDGSIYNLADFQEGAEDNEAALIAKLYLRYGLAGALRRLNGDFALALYDLRDHTFYLARDRFGLKPLYYHQHQETVAFASRPRALLQLPGLYPLPNRQFVARFAAGHYRYFDNEPQQSPYADIAQLPAATILRLHHGHSTLSKYWDLEPLPDLTSSEEELAACYRDLFLDAVRIRLRKATRPAFTLSGGMDSSSVLASSVRLTGNTQHAFSSVYTDKTYDEADEIRSMLNATVEQWHPIRVDDPELFSLVQDMISAHDEPVATATWLSHYLLCREVYAQGFGGLFGGLGGDELNAGEYEHYFFHFADLRVSGREDELRKEVALWATYHDHPLYRKNHAVMEAALRTMVDLSLPGRCLPDPQRLTRYFAALNPDYYDLRDFVPVMDHPFPSYLKNRAYQDLTRETAPCCLRAEDRQTMVFGLENFLPFFDHRVVELLFRVPGYYKIRNGVTKHLLRQAMKGILPEETRTRIKKTGWNAPAHLWFAVSNREPLLDLLHSQSFRERGIYNVREVERLFSEHCAIVTSGQTQENHMMFFWQLVNLELWFREACGTQAAESARSESAPSLLSSE
jgi:asparagine synthase (glutamine-hydrolysing)